MNSDNNYRRHNTHSHDCRKKGPRCGPSSYYVHDSGIVFEKLALKQGDILLDLGCGAGDYSIHAAGIVGESGSIFAVDLWPEMLDKILTYGHLISI